MRYASPRAVGPHALRPCLRGAERTHHAPGSARPVLRPEVEWEGLGESCSDSPRPQLRLRLGSGAAGARPPCDLGLRLALRPQKRRARNLVDGTCKRRMTTCTRWGALCAAFTGHPRWSPIELARRIPAGPRVGSRKPLGCGRRSLERPTLGDRTRFGRPFARPSSPGDSGDVAACHAARFTEIERADPFPKVGPARSPRLPRRTSKLAPRWRPRCFSSSLDRSTSRAVAPRSRTNHPRSHRFCHTRCLTSTT